MAVDAGNPVVVLLLLAPVLDTDIDIRNNVINSAVYLSLILNSNWLYVVLFFYCKSETVHNLLLFLNLLTHAIYDNNAH